MEKNKHINICAPVYNEESGISEFLCQVDQAIKLIIEQNTGITFSLILADDGSADNSVEKIMSYNFKNFSSLHVYSLSRNFGHSSAVSACIELADGDAVILMDADLQDWPMLIPKMVSSWLAGNECIRMRRKKRSEGIFFKIGAALFYRVYQSLSGLESGIGIFGLYDKKVIRVLRSFPERVRYIPGLISLVGYKTDIIIADRNKRHVGETRVGNLRLMYLALIGILSFSNFPIHMITMIGFLTSCLSFMAGFTVVAIKLSSDLAIPGWTSYLTVQFFIGGIILLSLGIIGEYLAIIFEEIKARPLFVVDQKRSKEFKQSDNKLVA